MNRLAKFIYLLFLLFYPCLAWYLVWGTETHLESWVLSGMSLSHFLLWLVIFAFWIFFIIRYWNSAYSPEKIAVTLTSMICCTFLLLIACVLLDARSSRREASASFLAKETFEMEPWKSRLTKDLDKDGKKPYIPNMSKMVIYPVKASPFHIVLALQGVIKNDDSRIAVETLLDGCGYYKEQSELNGESVTYIVYTLQCGYYRSIPLIKILYNDDRVVDWKNPDWYSSLWT